MWGEKEWRKKSLLAAYFHPRGQSGLTSPCDGRIANNIYTFTIHSLRRDLLLNPGIKVPERYEKCLRVKGKFLATTAWVSRPDSRYESAAIQIPLDAGLTQIHPAGNRTRGRYMRQWLRLCAKAAQRELQIKWKLWTERTHAWLRMIWMFILNNLTKVESSKIKV